MNVFNGNKHKKKKKVHLSSMKVTVTKVGFLESNHKKPLIFPMVM